MKSKKSNPLAARIKKVMQADEDVGKIAQATPVLIGHSVELFVARLSKGAAEIALARGDKTLTTAHLKASVTKDASLDFLQAIVGGAPELPTPSTKRPRGTAKGGEPGPPAARGRGRGRGRGRDEADASPPRKRAKKELLQDAPTGAVEVKSEPAAAQDTLAAHLRNGEELKVELKGKSAAAPAIAHQSAERISGTAEQSAAGTSAAAATAQEGVLQSPWEAQDPGPSQEQAKLEPAQAAAQSLLPQSLAGAVHLPAAAIEPEDDYDEE